MGAFMGLHEKSFRLAAAQRKRTRSTLSAIVNDSPWILYYDNKRRRPLRKAKLAFAQLIRPDAVSVHLFIFIFLIPVAALQHAVEEQRGGG